MRSIYLVSLVFVSIFSLISALPAITRTPSPIVKSSLEDRALPSPYDELVYHVPGTRTIVYARVKEDAIEPMPLAQTVTSAYERVKSAIAIHGDGPLPQGMDPYVYDGGYGCFFYAESNATPAPGARKQHLTWGILRSLLIGLYRFAITDGYSREMDWRVLDSGWGIVGNGYIQAGGVISAISTSNETVDVS